VRSLAGRLPVSEKMAMSRHHYPSAAEFLDDCAAAAADQVIADAGGPAWDAEAFARLTAAARDSLAPITARVLGYVAQVLSEAQEAELRLAGTSPVPALLPAVTDMRAQFAALIYAGFISATGLRRLPDLVRYLRGIVRRLDKLAGEQAKDAEKMAAVQHVTAEYQAALAELPAGARGAPAAAAIRWMIEELRVNLFAQVLGTPGPVSEKRILTAIDGLFDR
jgi:ATP-dependent helicase HrpA